MTGLFYYPSRAIIGIQKRIINRIAHIKLKRNQGLWRTISAYKAVSKSTGCNYRDYWKLYCYVRKHKPVEILECGTGVSTIVIAFALEENEAENGIRGRITSMEDIDSWYNYAKAIIPPNLSAYIDLVFSERTEYYHSIFRGVGYKKIPSRAYDFVFIDGPGTRAPSDNTVTFDFDYINVVRKSNKPVFAILDNRLSTCYVFQKIFGLKKVKYYPELGLSYIGPCSKKDILSGISGKASFSSHLHPFLKNELNLRMNFQTIKSKKPIKNHYS